MYMVKDLLIDVLPSQKSNGAAPGFYAACLTCCSSGCTKCSGSNTCNGVSPVRDSHLQVLKGAMVAALALSA